VGVARYVTKLIAALPDDLKRDLPTVEQIETELAPFPEVQTARKRNAKRK